MSSEPAESRSSQIGAVPDMDGLTNVRLLVPDMHGVSRAKTVTPDMLRGIGEDGHSWPSPLLAADLWQNIPDDSMEILGTGDVSIFPIFETFTRLPWSPSTGVVICEAFREDHLPAPTPRGVLTRVLDDARQTDYELKIGAELEFFIYTDDEHGRPPFGMNEWFTSQAISRISGFVEDLYRFLPAMGLPLYEVLNEHAAGQMEINMRPGVGVAAIDTFTVMKLAIKEVAALHGLRVTTMCKPSNDAECATSGLHIHQVLHRADDNAFLDTQSGAPGLNEVATQYIAGQLEHAPAITAFAAPTVNAYKRYRPGTWAPTRAGWGMDNRTAMVRGIVAGANTRVENRIGASDANPYLLVAAQAAAGIDGIRKTLKASEPASHNIIDDETYAQVPLNLPDAIRALDQDTELVEAMGAEFCQHFLAVQQMVWDRYQDHVSDWEIREYLNVL